MTDTVPVIGDGVVHEGILYRDYTSDSEQLPTIIHMITRDLSEPYSIYTYRYFVDGWPSLTILAHDENDPDTIIGCVLCEITKKAKNDETRGYIAMLSINPEFRRRGIAKQLVLQSLRILKSVGCQMATLETECSNVPATRLYTKLGFQKTKLLQRYYLNGGDAWRLKLNFK